MPRRIYELKADLQRAGFTWRPSKGSHTIWTHPLLPGERLTIAGNDEDYDGRCQDREISKMLARLRKAQEAQS